MYYYIFEPPHEAKEYERSAQIKEYLSQLGIAGEMTAPTPGKTIEDLVASAIAKRYSTIIAVGGTEIINRVARALEPHEVVFGIIPFIEDKDLGELIGTLDWKQAAEQLKKRRWHAVRMGLINNQLGFLTPTLIQVPRGMEYTIVAPDFELCGVGGEITIAPGRLPDSQESHLLVRINAETTHKKSGFFTNLFNSRPSAPQNSQFFLSQLEVHTSDPLPVIVAGTTLCSTPISCQPQAKALRLIVAKGSATTEV